MSSIVLSGGEINATFQSNLVIKLLRKILPQDHLCQTLCFGRWTKSGNLKLIVKFKFLANDSFSTSYIQGILFSKGECYTTLTILFFCRVLYRRNRNSSSIKVSFCIPFMEFGRWLDWCKYAREVHSFALNLNAFDKFLKGRFFQDQSLAYYGWLPHSQIG